MVCLSIYLGFLLHVSAKFQSVQYVGFVYFFKNYSRDLKYLLL